MRIGAVNNYENTNFRGIFERVSKPVESAAATLQTKTSSNRKTISIELHNALVKLTAYRVALIFSALFGTLGYKVADNMADNDTEDFANAVQTSQIDMNGTFEIKDVNNAGTADIVLQTKDSATVVLDLKNSNVLMETTGLKKVE